MLTAAIVFGVTYLVLGLQRLPRLHIGRPAGALLGAVAMVATGVLGYDEARRAIDLDTLLFLLGMMVVLAYLELSGFFELVERRALSLARSPRQLLWIVVLSAGVLSALFMNDTICLMLTPVVLRLTKRLELPPVPYLIGVAIASNVGSACSLIGNPQNALIGVRSGLGFVRFVTSLGIVSVLGLLAAGAILVWLYRREVTAVPLVVPPPRVPPQVSRWMLASGLLSGAGMVVALCVGVRPAAAAMTAAAAVILAGATRPRVALQKVDWSLLLLFGGLFVVMEGLEKSGLAALAVTGIAGPLAPAGPTVLARLGAAVTILSQLVSNVPAVMLFVPPLEALPPAAVEGSWLALAAFSTLAGNLTILASVANLIVFETAAREGVRVSFSTYLRAGLPITLVTLAIAWCWLAL
jgi:Na+/H+ antiporter NhaD/arsenite permease-like protein